MDFKSGALTTRPHCLHIPVLLGCGPFGNHKELHPLAGPNFLSMHICAEYMFHILSLSDLGDVSVCSMADFASYVWVLWVSWLQCGLSLSCLWN